MTETHLAGDGDKKIHITISLDDKSSETKPQPEPTRPSIFVDESRLIETANLVAVEGKRNTEAGLTAVRLLRFREADQGQKLLGMLGESFPEVIDQLKLYLHLLGAHPRAVMRRRAAQAVGELMCEVDFIRYKDSLLLPWALSDRIDMNSSAAIALQVVIESDRYEENVKTLLKHWITSSSHNLQWTAVASLVQLGPLWPEYAIELLELVLKRPDRAFLVPSLFVVRRLSREGHAGVVLTQLKRWMDKTEQLLRHSAALIFLEEIDLDQIVGDNRSIDCAVDIFGIGLRDRKLANSGEIRSAMLDKLRAWGEASFDDPDKESAMVNLFKWLYARTETERDRERIAFHVERWRRKEPRFGRIAQNLVYP